MEGPRKKKKSMKQFRLGEHWTRRVALKIMYLGWSYNGNTINAGDPDPAAGNTVEARVIEALERVRLIESLEQCKLSRCGRTDKGVSAWANVVALTVRSNLKGAGAAACTDPGMIPPTETPLKAKDVFEEVDYCRQINKALPPDIRILAWSPIDMEFDARFNARGRVYKYYFLREGLDVDAMREGIALLKGLHDFRNFCKIDVKATKTWERRILETSIEPAIFSRDDVFVARIEGSAFLWHQIRFIMAVLFQIGRKLEQPSVISAMLDTKTVQGRPEFAMASDVPLVLYQCHFGENDLEWRKGPGLPEARNAEAVPNHFSLYRQLHAQYENLMLKATIIQEMMQNVAEDGDVERLQHAGDKSHVPLLKRNRLKTVEQRLAELEEKTKDAI